MSRVLSSITCCEECGATVEYEGRDLRYDSGMPYFICPVCHRKTYPGYNR